MTDYHHPDRQYYHDKEGQDLYTDNEGQMHDDQYRSKSPEIVSTIVTDMDTFWEVTYSLPPQEALVAAYEQSKKNFNTWTYKDPSEYDIKCVNNRTLILSNFTCRK